MKNFIYFIFVFIIYIFLFVLDGENVPKISKIKVEPQHAVIKKESPKTVKIKTKNKIAEKIIIKTKGIYRKISYPSKIKKGNVTLFVNNPTQFDMPSNRARVDACKLLINEINGAKSSIYFAIYGIEGQDEIVKALINAKNRGVQVKGVSDSNEQNIPSYSDMQKLKEKIDIKFDNSKALMHNKFFITDNKTVMTGSMNISNTGCGGYNANSVAFIEEPFVVEAYKKEFEQMYFGKFKNSKTDFSSHPDNSNFGVYFSPKGGIYENLISKELKSATKEIRVSIFVLTHYKIISDLIEAKKRGVEVKVILDALGASQFKKRITNLRNEGVKVKVENWGGKNHEKTISIDNKTLIMGSSNLSYSGFLNNDENVLVIKDKDIVEFYNGFFDKLYNSLDDIYSKIFVRAESFESHNSCYDGIDNNFDGKIDLEDDGCKVKSKKRL